MRCIHCQSLMFEAEVVLEGHTEQILFQCPTCSRNHLSSRPMVACESGTLVREGQGTIRIRVGSCPDDSTAAVV